MELIILFAIGGGGVWMLLWLCLRLTAWTFEPLVEYFASSGIRQEPFSADLGMNDIQPSDWRHYPVEKIQARLEDGNQVVYHSKLVLSKSNPTVRRMPADNSQIEKLLEKRMKAGFGPIEDGGGCSDGIDQES
jgi:hypothetical protein